MPLRSVCRQAGDEWSTFILKHSNVLGNQSHIEKSWIIEYSTIVHVVYHEEVILFIKRLQKPTQAKVLKSIELVEKYGEQLGMPHVKKITPLLYELRIRGNQEVRIFFSREDKEAVLIHGFIKKTQKTPQKEIKTAEKRKRSLT